MKPFLLITFSLLILSSPAGASSPPDNFREVDAGVVFRGARPQNADQIAYLANELKVKTIVNLQGGDLDSPWIGFLVPYFEAGETPAEIEAEGAMAASAGIANYVSLPLNSMDSVTPAEARRIDAILAILKDPAQQPVFVHCAHGADRTGLVIALHRIFHDNWGTMGAYEEMRADGHGFESMIFTSAMDEDFLEEAVGSLLDGRRSL